MSESSIEEAAAAVGLPLGLVRTFEKPSPDKAPAGASDQGINLDSVMNIPVTMQVILGGTKMQVSDLMKLASGAIIPLDNRVGEPVDVVVNGRVVARGELVVMDDDNTRFGVSLTEIVGSGGNGRTV